MSKGTLTGPELIIEPSIKSNRFHSRVVEFTTSKLTDGQTHTRKDGHPKSIGNRKSVETSHYLEQGRECPLQYWDMILF